MVYIIQHDFCLEASLIHRQFILITATSGLLTNLEKIRTLQQGAPVVLVEHVASSLVVSDL